MKIRVELLKCGAREIHCSDCPHEGWTIAYPVLGEVGTYWTDCAKPFELRFATEKQAENAIAKIGERRIKKYLFGVED